MMSSEVVERCLKLIAELKQRTTGSLLPWAQSDRGESFEASIRGFSFVVGTRDNDGAEPYMLNVYDSRGSIQMSILSSDEEYPESVRQGVRDLFTTVNNNESHVINTLDAALQALENEPPF